MLKKKEEEEKRLEEKKRQEEEERKRKETEEAEAKARVEKERKEKEVNCFFFAYFRGRVCFDNFFNQKNVFSMMAFLQIFFKFVSLDRKKV